MTLRNAREELEAVDLMMRLRGNDDEPASGSALRERRVALEGRIRTLDELLEAMDAKEEETGEIDLEAAARSEKQAELARKKQGGCGDLTKTAIRLLRNAIAGFITIYLYFMYAAQHPRDC